MSLCTSHIYWLQLSLMYWNEPCVALDILKSVVHSLSHVWLFVTPRTSACQASRSFTISWNLHKLIFIESVIPPKNLVLCHSLILLPSAFSSIKVFLMSQLFSSGSGLLMNIQDWFPLGWLVWSCSPRDSQESSPTPVFSSLKASILQYSAFFMVQFSHPYMTTGKTIALTVLTIVGKLMSLLFNILSRFVINFLPRNKRLLILWLQWFRSPRK